MRLRGRIQRAYFSRFGLRQPSILLNSIPKAGTHLAKSILLGAGAVYAGHYDDQTAEKLVMSPVGRSVFATAHMRRSPVAGGTRLLLIRNPVDVTISMVMYMKARRDHPRYRTFLERDLNEAVAIILGGEGRFPPLTVRFNEYRKWAEANDAVTIEYDDIKNNPADLIKRCGLDPGVDRTRIDRSISRWNPTKRKKRLANEPDIKEQLLNTIQQAHPGLWREYQMLRARAEDAPEV